MSEELIRSISIYIIICYRKKMNFDIGPIQINKFLWYLQIYYWIRYKKNVLGEDVYLSSWRYGPVLPYVWRNFQDILKKSKEINDLKDSFFSNLDEEITSAAEKIIDQFSKYTPFQLVNKTHKDLNYLYDEKNGTYNEQEINLKDLNDKIIINISDKYEWQKKKN